MIAEIVARLGRKIIAGIPPDGRQYWAARSWDRDTHRDHPLVGDSFQEQERIIGSYLERYGKNATRATELACGTGRFTRLIVGRTDCREIVALDISAKSLELSRRRVPEQFVEFRLGDFWAEDGIIGDADLVVCVDAIHHLGNVRSVLERICSQMRPGAVFIGNVWVSDRFHEFERQRYGTMKHLLRTLGFAWAAVLIRVSGRRLKVGSYRTQLVRTTDVKAALEETFGVVKEFTPNPYFASFVCAA
jgi:SAM-dependent methyltransferase